LPVEVPIILCHAEIDQYFNWQRGALEEKMYSHANGDKNAKLQHARSAPQHLLYLFCHAHAASGEVSPSTCVGRRIHRDDDPHRLDSLLKDNLLPRLVDALTSANPEQHTIDSWYDVMPEERRDCELSLGYDIDQLQKHWAAPTTDSTNQQLCACPSTSVEYHLLYGVGVPQLICPPA